MMIVASSDFLKSQVKGYTKKDGTVVKPYNNNVGKLIPSKKVVVMGKKPSKGSLFGGPSSAKTYGHHGKKFSDMLSGMYPKKKPFPKKFHAKRGEKGQRVGLYDPHKPTPATQFHNPGVVTTVTPGDKLGDITLNGLKLSGWKGAPTTEEDWATVPGQIKLDEKPLDLGPDVDPKTGKKAYQKRPASGVIVEEADGRVWVISPTNKFGGYTNSFPKGGQDDGLSLQANAIKECFEESGLQVEITGLLGDIERTTSIARYYRAKRVGGSPADMGWESQAVHLVPKDQLADFMDQKIDKDLVGML